MALPPVVDVDATRANISIALAELHSASPVGAMVRFRAGEWPRPELTDLVEGAGFELVRLRAGVVTATRLWTLPDYVAPDLQLLICGLNPSPSSADSGVGFHRPGNRFWPAAVKAGVATVDRDPVHALRNHGMGMTDIVKRTTRRADELDRCEYEAGLQRVERLVERIRPKVICMVGLAGWRAAVDRKAQRGWQPDGLGGVPVYLMPSTSGLNAHDTVDTLAQHFVMARKPAGA